MDKVKQGIWKYFGTLIMDRDTKNGGQAKVSLGRLFLTILLIVAVLIWTGVVTGKDGQPELPSTMVTVLMSLMVYVLGSKGVGAYAGAKKETAEIERQKIGLGEEPGHMPD